eukprot:7635467-Ditylum_brightwellii.AAC.1
MPQNCSSNNLNAKVAIGGEVKGLVVAALAEPRESKALFHIGINSPRKEFDVLMVFHYWGSSCSLGIHLCKRNPSTYSFFAVMEHKDTLLLVLRLFCKWTC